MATKTHCDLCDTVPAKDVAVKTVNLNLTSDERLSLRRDKRLTVRMTVVTGGDRDSDDNIHPPTLELCENCVQRIIREMLPWQLQRYLTEREETEKAGLSK